jgi:hypothetical protein
MFTFDQTRAWLDTDLENGTDEHEEHIEKIHEKFQLGSVLKDR